MAQPCPAEPGFPHNNRIHSQRRNTHCSNTAAAKCPAHRKNVHMGLHKTWILLPALRLAWNGGAAVSVALAVREGAVRLKDPTTQLRFLGDLSSYNPQ